MDNRRLFEILPERFEKASEYISLLISYHFQRHIIKSCNGSPRSNNRNTADQTDQVQNAEIRHLSHKNKKFIIHAEQPIHTSQLLRTQLFNKVQYNEKCRKKQVSHCSRHGTIRRSTVTS